MVLALDTLPRKLAAALLAVLATVPLSHALWRQYRADVYSREGTRESLEKAIAVEPGHAELHNRLGRVLLYSTVGDTAQAQAALGRAVELDPRTASFGVDLALSLELRGEFDAAARELERARRAEPRTPGVLWQEMNFWLRREQNARALELARELLQMSPEYTSRVVPLLTRVTTGSALLDSIVPRDLDALGVVLEIFRREDRMDSAERLWQASVELGRPLPEGYVRAFVDWVLARGAVELAQRAWSDGAQHGWIPVEPTALDEPFYNADFRFPLLNYGFDWRVQEHPDASVWVESRGPKAGQQSLCVQFNEDARREYGGVFHYVAVQPVYHYALRAAMRSEKLMSHAGAWLQVQEMAAGRAVVPSTEPIVGSNHWKEVSLQFETGPETRLVRLVLVRPAASLREPPASGLVCIAPLEWKALGPGRAVNPTPGATR